MNALGIAEQIHFLLWGFMCKPTGLGSSQCVGCSFILHWYLFLKGLRGYLRWLRRWVKSMRSGLNGMLTCHTYPSYEHCAPPPRPTADLDAKEPPTLRQ